MVRASLQRCAELLERGGASEAEALARESVEKDADCAEAHELLGIARLRLGSAEAGLPHLERACQLEPDSARFQHNLGGALRELGRFPEAEAMFRAAVVLEPCYVEAIQGLVEVRRFQDPGDPILRHIEDLLVEPSLSQRVRSFLHFAAGKAWDDLGQPDHAFPHFAAANQCAEREFDEAAHRREMQEVLFANGRARLLARYEQRREQETPPWRMLFLVGMPRSGTSLLEQMLSRHPQIHGAGELPDVQAIARQICGLAGIDGRYPQDMGRVPNEILAGLAQTFQERLANQVPDGTRWVIDKNPANAEHLGLICELFPSARVVHALRDPRDVCLSAYFQNFANGQEWSFDLAGSGRFHRTRDRLTEHWQQSLPIPQRSVRYEELVTGPEPVLRRTLEFLGCAFDQRCLAPERADRPVATASAWQVRQPVHRRSIGRWRAYAHHLEPLLSALAE